jgi:RecB family exonuclease/superfamily I DNA/RNA helicase
MTFRDLSTIVVGESGKRVRLLPALVERELLRRVVNAAAEKNELAFFADAAGRAGFIDLLADHLRELKRGGVTPDAYAKAKPRRGSLEQHRELALLYRRYEEQLAAHGLADEEGMHGLARDLLAAATPNCLRRLELVVADGFTDFTPTQHDILRLLAERSQQLVVTLLHEAGAVAGLCEAGSGPVAGLCEAGVTDPSYSAGSGRVAGLCEAGSVGSAGVTDPSYSAHPRRDLFAKTAATRDALRRRHVNAQEREFPVPMLAWPALDYALRHVFRNPAKLPPPSPEAIESLDRFEIVAAASAHDEFVQLARRIKALLLPLPFREGPGEGSAQRRASVTPEEITVVLRSLNDAAPRIREVFTEYGIPYYLEADVPVASAPLVRSLQSLLKLADENWPFRRVVGVITNHTLSAMDATARRAADWLVRDLQIAEGRDALVERVERLAATDTPLEELGAQRRRRVTAARQALPLVQLLAGALGALPREATARQWRDALAKLGAELGFFPTAPDGDSLDLAAWQAISSHLAALSRLDADLGQPPRMLTLRELIRALSEVAEHGRLPRRHDDAGRVRVLSAPTARTLPAKHLFLAGMSEQAFPLPERAGRLATDAEYRYFAGAKEQSRRGLFAESAEQKGTVPLIAPTRAQEEMLLFYELVSRAEASLTISYPALDDKAQDLPPSPYVLELERVFGAAHESKLRPRAPQLSPVPSRSGEPSRTCPTSSKASASPHVAYGPTDLRLKAVARALDKEADQGHLAALFSSPPAATLARSIDAGLRIVQARARGESHGPAEGIITSPAVEARLKRRFGPDHLWSPSQWESYAECPYRFFMENVLGLEPLGDLALEVDHRRRGSLAHDMLARFHGKLRDTPPHEWSALVADQERFVAELEKTLQEVLDSSGMPPGGIDAAFLELDRREIARWIARYGGHFEKYAGAWVNFDVPMMPAFFEFRFGAARPGESSPEDAASLDKPFVLDVGGEHVLVTGRIDRIDVGQRGGKKVFNVIDYKSGQRPTLTREKVLTGQRLQPALYVMAAEELVFRGDEAVPLWAGYWSMKNGVTTSERYSLRCSVESGEATETWDALKPAVIAKIREFVYAIRAGAFPVASRDPDCTSRCDFHTVCRIGQVRSLGKDWVDAVECQESSVESSSVSDSQPPAPSP